MIALQSFFNNIWGFFIYAYSNIGEILDKTLEHVELTFSSVAIAILIGVPLGIATTFMKKNDKYVIGSMNVIQAIPSLALLGFLIPILNIGTPPAIFMVVLYSLLPIVKNTYTAIKGIDKRTLEAAKGIGLTDFQILRKVTLPLSLPVIMAGVRISAVQAVGLMTIAAFVGAGGLGELVLRGVNRIDNYQILIGAIPACMLALLIDYLVGKIEIIVTPAPLLPPGKKISKFGKRAFITVIAAIFAFIGGNVIYNSIDTKETITIGSKNYTEQIILGNIYADMLEYYTDYNIERNLNLGSTQVTFLGLQNGGIDIYPEFTGTAYSSILGYTDVVTKDEAFDIVKRDYEDLYGITWLPGMAYNNTYAIAVRNDFAEKYNLEKVSDLKPYAKDMIISPTLEFADRSDGLPGLEEAYGFDFGKVMPVDGSPRYTALDSGACDAVDAFTTDGLLNKFDFKILEDDLNFFPYYYACPVMKIEFAEEYPDVVETLKRLDGKITEDEMREMNYQVDVLGRDEETVAHEYLIESGLIGDDE